MMTEAVGYVSGRSEGLCAVWFLAALLFGRRAMVSGSKPAGVASLLCGLAAAASKEAAAGLPLVLLAYDWLVRPGDDRARRRRLWLVFVPILTLVAAAAVYRVAGLRLPSGVARTPIVNLWTQAIVIWRYVGLLVWPAGQTIMHDARQVSMLADPIAILALAALGTAAAGAWLARRTRPLVAVGVVWFLAAIAPSSSVIPLREVMAEHRVYLASGGLFLILAAAVAPLAHGLQRGRRRLPLALPLFVVGLIALSALLTVRRNEVWASPVALWAEAAERSPAMWEPHYALGDALREAGDCAAAVGAYEIVVKMRPAHRDAYTNLGICLAQTGRLEEAETAFRRVLQIDPSFARGYTNLGALALVAGDPGRARDFYREAIVQDPGNVLARMQLARLYEGTFGDYHSAARMCGEARAIAPATPGVVECVERNRKLAAAKDAGR
jgi:tetratricopeptide (TPR) repeat protein